MDGPAISATGLVKRYGDVVAVDHVDLRVERGEIFGLLGPNGAGKTTTMEILEGLRVPDQGAVEVAGFPVLSQPQRVKERIGVLLQGSRLLELLTVREIIALYASFYPSPAPVDQLLDALTLRDKARERVERLSGGQRQRVALALALVGDPEVVFLDEPTTGLDPQARRSLWDVIRDMRDRGRTVLLSTHYMEEAEILCDRVAVMDHGRFIGLDTPQALIAKHSGEHALSFAPSQPIDDGALRELPWVSGLRRDGDTVTLYYTVDTTQALRLLLDLSAAAGWSPADLRTRSATLEDVFLSLTGRSLRD